MYYVTKSANSYLSSLKQEKRIYITGIQMIMERMPVAPDLSKTDGYIITDTDLVKNQKAEFISMLDQKHPDCRIMIIMRKKPVDEALSKHPGFNKVLIRPKNAEVIDGLQKMAIVVGNENSIPTATPEESEIQEYVAPQPKPVEIPVTEDDFEEFATVGEPDTLTVEVPEDEPEESPDDFISRVPTKKLSDMANYTTHLQMKSIIEEVSAQNKQYQLLCESLNVLQDKIDSVLIDPRLDKKERMTQLEAILVSRQDYIDKTNDILETKVISIIRAVTDKMRELVKSRLTEIDKQIADAKRYNNDLSAPTIITLNEKRADLNSELLNMGIDVDRIGKAITSFADDAQIEMIDKSYKVSSSETYNDLVAQTGTISNKEVDRFANIVNESLKVNDTWRESQDDIKIIISKLIALHAIDNERIAALSSMVELLRAKNVEDTVSVRGNLLKGAFRLYIAEEGTGRTIIPYIISKYRSYGPKNVLHIDLTGTCKLEDYGVENVHDLLQYFEILNEEKLCLVKGEIPDDYDELLRFIQRFKTALMRAVDYYVVINVVIDVEQLEAIQQFLPECLSVTYLVDMHKPRLNKMRQVIEDTECDNVAQRVMFNKCTLALPQLLKILGLQDRIDFQILKVDYLEEIESAMIYGSDPSALRSLESAMAGVMKYA